MPPPAPIFGPAKRVVMATPSSPLIKCGTLSTYASALAAPADLITVEGPQPNNTNGSFVFSVSSDSAQIIAAYGTAAADRRIGMRVYGWKQIIDPSDSDKIQWTAVELWRGYATTCTKVGVSGGIIADTHYYCDGYTTVYDGARSNGSTQTVGITGQDTTQGIVVDFNGCVMGEIRGGLHSNDIAAGTAATSFGFVRSPLSNT